MNKVEKIKAEIERRKKTWNHQDPQYVAGGKDVCDYLLGFIDSLEEEPVSNDLEEFTKRESELFGEREYEIDFIDRNALAKGYYWGVKAGAQWQKEQMMKNSDFINEVEWEDDIHKLFREKSKKVKLMIVEEE